MKQDEFLRIFRGLTLNGEGVVNLTIEDAHGRQASTTFSPGNPGYAKILEALDQAYSAEKIRRIPLESSFLKSAGYDRTLKRLVVEMKAGSLYAYENVPLETWLELLEAPSHGAYYNRFIRNFDAVPLR